ncbi:calcium/proton exchanger [Tanacetum coccineum]
MMRILEDIHPKKPISHVDSDSDGETNVPLDDVANVVEKIEHENEGKKPKTLDDDKCETSKQGSKKGDGRKVVNKTLSKAIKKRWKKEGKLEKGSLNKVTVPLVVGYMDEDANNQMFRIVWAVVRVENNVNWSWFLSLIRDDLNMGDGGGINIISDEHKTGYPMLSTDSVPGGYREVEVRRRNQDFGVNLHQMNCVCNMWQLSGIPCVHVMAGYMHMKINPDFGVDECQPPPLSPVERKMPGRLRKKIRHLTEDDNHEAPLSSMPPSTSNTMLPPLTPSSLNTKPPPPTPSPSTSNTMPPPSGSNTMPPPPKPSSSNTIPSHATLGSNTNTGKPAKSNASSSIGGSKGGATTKGGSRGGSKGGASRRGRGSNKRGRGSNTIPYKGLRDEASDEEHQFNMDMEAVYQFEREQITIDKDDQFWEECAMEFDHVEEHRAQDKGMQDVAAGKQPMLEDVAAGKQPMIEDEPLQGGVDLPTQESTIKANPKHTRSKAVEVPNKMRIFHKNRGRSERIFNHKMKNL